MSAISRLDMKKRLLFASSFFKPCFLISRSSRFLSQTFGGENPSHLAHREQKGTEKKKQKEGSSFKVFLWKLHAFLTDRKQMMHDLCNHPKVERHEKSF